MNFKLFKKAKKEEISLPKKEDIRCYSYCLGLNKERELKFGRERYETGDIKVLARFMIKDLKSLGKNAVRVKKDYILKEGEELLALRARIMYMHGDYLVEADFHVMIKRKGLWYTKFGKLDPEVLPEGIDIEEWDWRDKNLNVPKSYFNTPIEYICIS